MYSTDLIHSKSKSYGMEPMQQSKKTRRRTLATPFLHATWKTFGKWSSATRKPPQSIDSHPIKKWPLPDSIPTLLLMMPGRSPNPFRPRNCKPAPKDYHHQEFLFKPPPSITVQNTEVCQIVLEGDPDLSLNFASGRDPLFTILNGN